MGNDICKVVLDVLNNNRNPTDLNYTYITLVPKVSRLELPKEFRHISLCNVTMKLVTKCSVNQMKNVLPLLINENQSTFVPGRLITDNVLIAFETFHYLKQKTKGHKGYMALKLDITNKAYDWMD